MCHLCSFSNRYRASLWNFWALWFSRKLFSDTQETLSSKHHRADKSHSQSHYKNRSSFIMTVFALIYSLIYYKFINYNWNNIATREEKKLFPKTYALPITIHFLRMSQESLKKKEATTRLVIASSGMCRIQK